MSHNRDHIIINALIKTDLLGPLEVAALEEIMAKGARVSGKDATTVANIVRRQLRKPDTPQTA
jgi:hypothetical protein